MSTFKFENNIKLDKKVEEQFEKLSQVIEETSKDIRVIAVTSSSNKEGKSFVSFHLARCLAKKDYRVLVLMADVRKTTVVNNMPVMGLVDVIDGKAEIDKIIYKTDVKGIDVVFSGATRKNEIIDISRSVYGVMLKCLKDDYNYIIVDMSTMSKTDNDKALLKEADAGIMVIEPNKSSKKRLLNNINSMESYNCKVLGAILNNK